MLNLKIIVALSVGILSIQCSPKEATENTIYPTLESEELAPIEVGAAQLSTYLPVISEQRVALVVNQTSTIGATHLVDTLISSGIDIKAIFSPEHGFRGQADAGEKITDAKDPQTGIPLLSLYGKKRQPSAEDLANIDVVIFDIQDVGARFYTYISTMHEVMDACAKLGKKFIVFDRPNPNGYYVDGPVLDLAYQSFVGMHPIPVVHGMTIGEYAQMINGEGWLPNGAQVDLQVIKCAHYDHTRYYDLPIKPSPNLPNMHAIHLYPSICFFEGTVASEGRGTTKQFQVFGHPDYPAGDYEFTPISRPGAKYPKLQDKQCKGYDLSGIPIDSLRQVKKIELSHFINFYNNFPDKDNFFIPNLFIDKLAGGKDLREQIIAGKTEAEIRATWQPDLKAFKTIRKKYLLYDDFE